MRIKRCNFELNIPPVKTLIHYSFLLFFTGLIACKKTDNIPLPPVITFAGFKQYQNSFGKDSIGVMIIDFADGDGDIGYTPADTLPPFDKKGPYYYNFVIKYFERQNGVLKEVKLRGTNNSRIPYLTPEGKEKKLTGNIAMNLFINNPLSHYDTIRFEAFIYDRALNKSNVVQTNDIIVHK
jgi:hypothetical protein